MPIVRAGRENPESGILACASASELFMESDAVVLVTEWPEYRELAWEELRASMRHPFVLDGRNFLDRDRLVKAGYRYSGFGR